MRELESNAASQELAAWRADWEDEEPAATLDLSHLRRTVRRKDRNLKLVAGLQVLVMLFGLVVLGWVARRSSFVADWYLLAQFAGLYLFIFVWDWRSRRQLWRSRADTTAAFLERSIEHCRFGLVGIRIGWWFLAGQLLLFVPWVVLRAQEHELPSDRWPAYLFGFAWLAFVGAVCALVVRRRARRLRRELSSLEELRGSVQAQDC